MCSSVRAFSGTFGRRAVATIVAILLAQPAAAQFQQLHIFTGESGKVSGGVVAAPDGSLYGATPYGGTFGLGSIFKMTPQADGKFVVTTLTSFDGFEGIGPSAAPVFGNDGALYGTTEWGSDAVLYRVTLDGTLTVLHRFAPAEGARPSTRLFLASDGTLYGTAPAGGSTGTCPDCGTVFKVSPAGEFSVVHSFSGTDGMHPLASLVAATDGNLYGTTGDGGTAGRGTVFRLSPAGTLTTVHHFTAAEGQQPEALMDAGDGTLYGATRSGGASGYGTLFRMGLAGNMIAVWPFGAMTGVEPRGQLVLHPDGGIYGTTRYGGSGGGTIFRLFDGVISTVRGFEWLDGTEPLAGLAPGPDGVLYGSTTRGGPRGDGTIFSLSASGVMTVAADFGFADGAHPPAGLTIGSDGAFYGVTSDGGLGSGAVFRIDSINSSFGVVHRLPQSGEHGMIPNGELVLGADGALYGTTHMGGQGGGGTVFRVAPDGAVNVVHNFATTDGEIPRRLTRGADDTLYGTTVRGGATGHGTVFRIAASGMFTTIHHFSGTDGSGPAEGVIEAADGKLYGTTLAGGANDAGIVFRLDPLIDELTPLYAFPQKVDYNTWRTLFQARDGTIYLATWDTAIASVSRLEANGTLTSLWQPYGGPSPLIQGSDGLLYGTTHNGGSWNAGTVFQLDHDGAVNILHSFDGNGRGGPYGRLLQAPDGSFYGTTYGAGDGGTVFRIAALPTTLAITPVVRPYGGAAAVKVVVTAEGNVPLAGKTIALALNAVGVGTGRTNTSGELTIEGIPLDGIEVGTYPAAITATFAGDDGFRAAAGVGTLTIVKATPTVSWSAPAPIPYGAPLGAAQLNAVASVPGTFDYTPPAGTVLPAGFGNVLTVVFTPLETTRYNNATATVSIAVLPPPTLESLEANFVSPAVAGQILTWTASASGGMAPLQFQFWRQDGVTWTMVRDYDTSPTYSWNTGAADAGTHALQVWVRSEGSTAVYDAWHGSGAFTILDMVPVRLTSLVADASPPFAVGSSISWTAAASGGRAPLQYQFWRQDSTGWRMVRDYSTSATYMWTPVAGDVGEGALQVWVRSAGSTANYEAWAGYGGFTVRADLPLTVSSLTASVSFPAPAAQPITWTATATGGIGPLEYQFWLYRSSTNSWSLLRDYAAVNSVTYTPTTAETQALQVWVRSGTSTAPYEAWRGSGSFTIIPGPLRLTFVQPGSIVVFSLGELVTFEVVPTGGVEPIEYQFWAFEGGAWRLLRDYSTQNFASWRLTYPFNCGIQVWARTVGSNSPYETWIGATFYVIKPPPPPPW